MENATLSAAAKASAKLVRMANDIATFFRSYPHDEAVAGVQEHIKAFWSPVMRRDLATAMEHDEGLDPLVIAAMRGPAGGHTPAAREKAGPGEVGEIDASDAG